MSANQNDTKEEIDKIICEIKDITDFDVEQDFIENDFFDSFDIMNLVMALEEKFRVEIDPDDITPENLASVSSILGLVNNSGAQV
ncbi:MAG: acyl carrier protein [Rhodospirillales bacterium]|nr:acyl carrier protein [Rhodospirillales bacterium]